VRGISGRELHSVIAAGDGAGIHHGHGAAQAVNPFLAGDRAAALVGDAAAIAEEDAVARHDAAGIHHGHGGAVAVNPRMPPVDRGAALVGDV
jgi:hypothetical protein